MPIVVRVGRYGPYLQRGDDRASIPEDLAPDELTVERAEELLAAPSNDRVLGTDPETGLDVSVKAGRFGPYVQLGEAGEGGGPGKPRTSSLFSTMDPATLTFEQALELLRIPRVVGTDPETGEEMVAHNGKFGPYLKRGTDTRSLASEDQLLTVTLAEAQAMFAQPKQRRGRTGGGPAARAGRRPGDRIAGGGQGGPFRAVCDRRDDQRLAAQGRRGRDDHHRAGLRAAGRPPGRRALDPQEGRRPRRRPAKKASRQEDRRSQEGGRPRRPAAKKAAKKAGGAKKAAAATNGAVPLELSERPGLESS